MNNQTPRLSATELMGKIKALVIGYPKTAPMDETGPETNTNPPPPYTREALWGKSLYVIVTGEASRNSDGNVQGVYELSGLPFASKDAPAINGPVTSVEIEEAALELFKKHVAVANPGDFEFAVFIDERTTPRSYYSFGRQDCTGPLVQPVPPDTWEFFNTRCHESQRIGNMRAVREQWFEAREATVAATRESLAANGWTPIRDGDPSALASKTLFTAYGPVNAVAHVIPGQVSRSALIATYQINSEAFPHKVISIGAMPPAYASLQGAPTADSLEKLSKDFLSVIDDAVKSLNFKHRLAGDGAPPPNLARVDPFTATNANRMEERYTAAKAAKAALTADSIAGEPISMDRLSDLVQAAASASNQRHVIVTGIHCVTGALLNAPTILTSSPKVDLLPWEGAYHVAMPITRELGEGSEFHKTQGFYANMLTAKDSALPTGWEQRLAAFPLPNSAVAMFVAPHDAAAEKLMRRTAQDDAWVLEAIEQGVIDAKTVMARVALVPGVERRDINFAKSVLRESLSPEFNKVRVRPKPAAEPAQLPQLSKARNVATQEAESWQEEDWPDESRPRMR